MTPKVSVCLPVFNGADHIEETVRSILEQSLADLELLVVDNASTDATVDVLGTLDDPRLTVRRNSTNLGAVANWNLSVGDARGEYVKLVCAGDILYPDCLAVQAEVLDRSPEVALVAGRRDVVDHAGRVVFGSRGLAGMHGEIPGGEAIRRIVRSGTNPLGEPPAVLLRRSALDAAGPFRDDLPYMVDVDMWCRVLRHGALFALDRTVCTFRLTTGSWSEQLAGNQAKQARAFLHRLRHEIPMLTTADELVGTARASVLGLARRVVYGFLALQRTAALRHR